MEVLYFELALVREYIDLSLQEVVVNDEGIHRGLQFPAQVQYFLVGKAGALFNNTMSLLMIWLSMRCSLATRFTCTSCSFSWLRRSVR